MRDVQLKGLRYSTDRAPANYYSGKYLSSLIKLESPDSNLARLGSVGFVQRRAYRINTTSECDLLTQRVRHDFLHTLGVVKTGVKSCCGKSWLGRRISGVLPTRSRMWLQECFVLQPRSELRRVT